MALPSKHDLRSSGWLQCELRAHATNRALSKRRAPLTSNDDDLSYASDNVLCCFLILECSANRQDGNAGAHVAPRGQVTMTAANQGLARVFGVRATPNHAATTRPAAHAHAHTKEGHTAALLHNHKIVQSLDFSPSEQVLRTGHAYHPNCMEDMAHKGLSAKDLAPTFRSLHSKLTFGLIADSPRCCMLRPMASPVSARAMHFCPRALARWSRWRVHCLHGGGPGLLRWVLPAKPLLHPPLYAGRSPHAAAAVLRLHLAVPQWASVVPASA